MKQTHELHEKNITAKKNITGLFTDYNFTGVSFLQNRVGMCVHCVLEMLHFLSGQSWRSVATDQKLKLQTALGKGLCSQH